MLLTLICFWHSPIQKKKKHSAVSNQQTKTADLTESVVILEQPKQLKNV